MKTLGLLFGGESKVKVMRLFLFNPDRIFSAKEIAGKTKLRQPVVKREIKFLEKIELIDRQSSRKSKDRKTPSWSVNKNSPYLSPLQSLLTNITAEQHQDILKKLASVGRLKMVLLSGIFIQNWEGRVDILIVFDRMKKRMLGNVLKKIEAELGTELNYVALDNVEFQNRLSIGDKLVRDVLDYPYKVAIDKLGIS